MVTALIIFLLAATAFLLYLVYSVYQLRKFLERKISETLREAAVKSLPPLTRWIYNRYFQLKRP